ncbi:peptide deformylase [Microlunatus capsulatus]|uniref:Peptide deformylase n=1 Tax=Microlunatus capsulatus TaxID=99117 RepID=A0ABS4ZCU1_9ACTN|nr:peptide deformylase [Microlunatus capsulatus]MBP2418883.1 peptide deformylase [Microlunatus capsulatus]
MATRPIRLFGDPILRQKAAPVVDFDKELRDLVRDLTDTMIDANGGGIAAPQIGVGLRVFTYVVEGEIGHVVNPQVEVIGDEEQVGPEGCLSIPDLPFDCRRPLHVVTTGFTMHGEPLRVEGRGRLSVIIEHETDHLDGILFVDRLDPRTRQAAEAAIREAEWSGGVVPEIRFSPHAPLRAAARRRASTA